MRIRFLREAGGIGDVVRCLGTVRSAREALPDAELWFYTIPVYSQLADMCPDVNRVVVVPPGEIGRPRKPDERRERGATPDPRIHRYLARHPRPWDATVDMYCPAFDHERETRGAVHLDRIDCWTGHAAHVLDITLAPRLARLRVPERAVGWAEGWLHAAGIGRESAKPVVGIQPLSVDPRRSLSRAQVVGVAAALGRAGVRVVAIHSRRGPRKEFERPSLAALRALRAPLLVAPGMAELVAAVSACDALVTGDSGLFHVAAAVGVPAVGVFGSTDGAVIARHYPLATAVEPLPRDRAGMMCAGGGPCYLYRRPSARKTCGVWCVASERIPPERIAAEVMRCVEW